MEDRGIHIEACDKSVITLEEQKNTPQAGLMQFTVGLWIRQIGERISTEAFDNLFSEEEYKMLLSPKLDDTFRLALFNNRLVTLFLCFSGKEDKDVLAYLAYLNPSHNLQEYSHNFSTYIVPFIKEFDLLSERIY